MGVPCFPGLHTENYCSDCHYCSQAKCCRNFPSFFLRFTGSTASDLLYSALLRSAVFFSSSFSSAIFLFSAVFPRFRSDRFYRFFHTRFDRLCFFSLLLFPIIRHYIWHYNIFHPPVLLHSFRKILSHLTTLFHIPGIFSYLFSSPVPFIHKSFFFAINDPKSTSLFWIIYAFCCLI